ncbi:MAG: hypothetical protein WCF16_06320, partial [Alphaproteobacteria bacterium]
MTIAGLIAAASLVSAGAFGLATGANGAEPQPGVGAPVKLAPPKRTAVPELVPDDYGKQPQAPSAAPKALPLLPAPGPTPPAAPAAGDSRLKPLAPAVQVRPLEAVDPDSAGVLAEGAGGLGVGMWDGTPRALVERLIPALPAKTTSRAARDLMARLLLSVAAVPEGPQGKSLIALRAQQLAAMGDAKAMAQLLDAAPAQPAGEELARLRVEALLLAGDADRACEKVPALIHDFPGPFWQKALIFCQITSGKPEQARLGLSVFKEAQRNRDPAFIHLAALLLGDKPKGDLPSFRPDAVDLAMIGRMGPLLPTELAGSDDPAVLRIVATAPDSDLAVRLAVAERAEAVGSLSAERLSDIYAAVTFTPEDLANALSAAEREGGARGRALL